MKIDVYNLVKRKFILTFMFIASAIVLISGACALALNKPTVVIFYTNWNALSRDAVPAVESEVSSYGKKVEFQKINIDDPSAPDKARTYGLTYPRTTPYVVVMDKNGKVLYQGIYNNQTVNQINGVINVLVQ